MKNIKDRFTNDIKDHRMIVIKDDGEHRHIRFKRPNTFATYFDIITWPGCLCYTGDMGTFVFSRVSCKDLFEFFKLEKHSPDMRYWAEKVIASDSPSSADGMREFSRQDFEKNARKHLLSWFKQNREKTSKQNRFESWELMNEILETIYDDGREAQRELYDFTVNLNDGKTCRPFSEGDFNFQSGEVFTFRFQWACYAIPFAICQYNKAKEEKAEQVLA